MNFQDNDEEYLKQLVEEEMYANCEESLYYYLIAAWSRIVPTAFVDSWHISAVCEHVQACIEGQFQDLIVCIPPRHLKSSIISVAAPTWTWGPHKKPETKFLTTSYSDRLSTRDALRSRRLIQNSWYRQRWDSVFKLTGDQYAKTRYENDRMGERISTSVGGLGTGEGFDVLIVDDPLNAKHETSEARLQEVVEWWDGPMSTRANDPATSRRIIIMQRITERDLVGHIKEKEIDKWTILELPMRYEPRVWVSPIGWSDPRSQEGELLCPARYDEKYVDDLEKRLGPYRFAAQAQQRPAPVGGGIIKQKWFKYWENPKQWEMIWQSWDLAMDEGENNDYTVGTVWAKIGAERYLLDMMREKLDINGQAKAVVMMSRRYPATRAVLIENKANGLALAKLLRDPAQIKIHGYQVPGITLVDPKNYGGAKRDRLLNCVSEFSSGAVYFPLEQKCPWVKDVEKELTFFPKAKHDDIVDSCTYSLNWIAQFGGASNYYMYQPNYKVNLPKTIPGWQYEATFGGAMSNRAIRDIFN